MLAAQDIKKDFPIFQKHPDLVYLDSTATSLKPQAMIDALSEYYSSYSANIFRGVYPLSEQATQVFEDVREKVSSLIGTNNPAEIVFTRNTTESLNLLAYSLTKNLTPEDEVVVTGMEHHSNLVPWQQLSQERGFKLVVIPFNSNGQIDPRTLREYISSKTRIFSFIHISNVLGTINPAEEFIKVAKEINPEITTIVDAAQSVPHQRVNVRELGCDFLAFSGHKMLGPTGVGVLWGQKSILEEMPPFLYGGEMVQSVTIEKTEFKDIPYKFEAGTPAIGEVIGLGAAIDYLNKIGIEKIEMHESMLATYTHHKLLESFKDSIRLLGPELGEKRAGIFSFVLEGIHPHDVAHILGQENICVRAGSHCAMPLHRQLDFSCPSTVRASLYLYNDESDVNRLIEGLKKAQKMFGKI